jgi:hypothetical protein
MLITKFLILGHCEGRIGDCSIHWCQLLVKAAGGLPNAAQSYYNSTKHFLKRSSVCSLQPLYQYLDIQETDRSYWARGDVNRKLRQSSRHCEDRTEGPISSNASSLLLQWEDSRIVTVVGQVEPVLRQMFADFFPHPVVPRSIFYIMFESTSRRC